MVASEPGGKRQKKRFVVKALVARRDPLPSLSLMLKSLLESCTAQREAAAPRMPD